MTIRDTMNKEGFKTDRGRRSYNLWGTRCNREISKWNW